MFGLFRRPNRGRTADAAKERLHILLAHERRDRARADMLPLLQRDIMEAIERRMEIPRESIDIRIMRGDDLSTLEINIDLPRHEALAASA